MPSETAMTEQHTDQKEEKARKGANGIRRGRLRKTAACVNHMCLESIIDTQVDKLIELQLDMCDRIGAAILKLSNGHSKNRRSD